MMPILAAEEATFALQGPKPAVPAGAWETYGWLGLGAVAVLLVLVWAALKARRAADATPAIAELEQALASPQADIASVTAALRGYLARVEPRAAASLSTEELTVRLGGLPIFLPARQPLLAVLHAADDAKFAGKPVQLPLLVAGIREAAQRIENARRTFAAPAVAPIIRPSLPTEPPPLPSRASR
jgi:hypothetical protein